MLSSDPNPDGPLLVEPAGLFNNRRWVGYVPPTPSRTVQGDPLMPVNGVVNLSADQAIVIRACQSAGGRCRRCGLYRQRRRATAGAPRWVAELCAPVDEKWLCSRANFAGSR